MPPTNRSLERMPHGRDNPLEVDWLRRSAQGRKAYWCPPKQRPPPRCSSRSISSLRQISADGSRSTTCPPRSSGSASTRSPPDGPASPGRNPWTKRSASDGSTAFEDRNPAKSGQSSFENRPRQLPPHYLKRLKANEEAWAFFQDQPPWYRRTVAWWIISAKKEDTRLRRLDRLIQDSAHGKSIPPLTRKPKA